MGILRSEAGNSPYRDIWPIDDPSYSHSRMSATITSTSRASNVCPERGRRLRVAAFSLGRNRHSTVTVQKTLERGEKVGSG